MKKDDVILKEKTLDMFDQLCVDREMGMDAVHVLSIEMGKTKKPMFMLSAKALKFFKSKAGDEHITILFSIFCILFSRILLDANVGVVTITKNKKKGGDTNEKGRIKKVSK